MFNYASAIQKVRTQPMLEKCEWIKVNKSLYTLVDENLRMVACIYTAHEESDGDKQLLWEAEIEGDNVGNFISLYRGKIAIQRFIYDWEIEEVQKAEAKRAKSEAKKKATQKKAKKAPKVNATRNR